MASDRPRAVLAFIREFEVRNSRFEGQDSTPPRSLHCHHPVRWPDAPSMARFGPPARVAPESLLVGEQDAVVQQCPPSPAVCPTERQHGPLPLCPVTTSSSSAGGPHRQLQAITEASSGKPLELSLTGHQPRNPRLAQSKPFHAARGSLGCIDGLMALRSCCARRAGLVGRGLVAFSRRGRTECVRCAPCRCHAPIHSGGPNFGFSFAPEGAEEDLLVIGPRLTPAARLCVAGVLKQGSPLRGGDDEEEASQRSDAAPAPTGRSGSLRRGHGRAEGADT